MRIPRTPASIRSRVLLISIAAGILPLVLIFFFSQVLMRRALIESNYARMENLTREVGREIGQLMTHVIADASVLAADPSLAVSGITEQECVTELNTADQYVGAFSGIALYDANGIQLASSSNYHGPAEVVADAFQKALAGEVVLTVPPVSSGTTGLGVDVYAPLRNPAALRARVLGARLSFDRISALLREVRLGERGVIVLLDSQGRILGHPDRSLAGTHFDGRTPAGFWMENGLGVYSGADGERQLFVTEVLSPTRTRLGEPWVLVGLLPRSEALAPLRKQAEMLLQVALLTLVFVYLGGLYVSRRLSRSLVEAAKAAQRVSLGDLDALVPESGPREVKMMAAAFNRMVQELRQHRHRLEAIVQERTESLSDSRRRLEQLTAHLQAAYESMIDGILVAEWPSGKIVAANRRFMGHFGLSPADLQGRTVPQIRDAIGASFAAGAGDPFHWDDLLRNSEQTGSDEWRVEKPEPLSLSTYTAPVRSESGELFARLWMFRDLTQQRVLEDELRQAQKMEAVGRLAGGIAHDFNNLLTGILGNLSMAEMEMPGGGESSQFIGAAKQAARRASELVHQLLGLSRRSKLFLERCDVNALLREVEGLLRHSIDPSVEICLEPDPELWGISADTTQLQQVLMNLCVNAIDAMPNGGRLTLKTQNVHVDAEEAGQWLEARAGDYVRLSVADMGQGMSAEVQSHLFEPFFTTKVPGKGTGLGLAMSYGIVKQHGGWITCYSELKRGTTFGIYLPRAHGAVPAAPEQSRETPVRGGNERVLIVDDEAAVRSVIQSILKRYGYVGLTAANGAEALEILGRDKSAVDLILLDLTMPKLSGRDTFRGIREVAPDLPVIISSGYPVELAAFEQETGLRTDAFVQKPYEAAALVRILREVLDKAGARRTA